MDTQNLFILTAVFVFTIAVVEMLYLMWVESRFTEKRKIKRRLIYISAGGKHGQDKLSLYKERVLKNASAWERLVFALPRITALDRMLLRGRVNANASNVILFTVALALGGFLIGYQWLPLPGAGLFLGALCGLTPFLLLRLRVNQTLATFDEQLPDTMDLLARALRAGHALSSAFEMVADEMPEPTHAEFAALVDEVNLGLSMQEALANLCDRMPSRDLRFFAVAVLVQKETGGNIAEVFDNISRLIRERMQFKRQLAALTAEGRMSAVVLLLLPVAMFGYIYFMNYDYIAQLWTTPVGKYLLAGAVFLQFCGFVMIRHIIRVEV